MEVFTEHAVAVRGSDDVAVGVDRSTSYSNEYF